MPGKPEQQVFEGLDQPVARVGEDTPAHTEKLISAKRRWGQPTEDHPLLLGSTEIPEIKELPPHTHTIAKGREVVCFDSDPGRGWRYTRTEGTLRVVKTGRNRKVPGNDLPEFMSSEIFTTHDSNGNPIPHTAGTLLATSYARPYRPSQSPPSGK